jgi:hypothetical protein
MAGQWSVMMVVEVTVSGGDQPGSDGGSGASAVSEAEGGGASGGGTCKCETALAAPAGRPREKDDRAG